MTQTNNSDLARYAPIVFRQMALWFPIIVGFIHQFLMLTRGIKCIYVFVDPPGSVCPFVTLEYQWWIVLLLGTFIAFFLAFLNRFQNVPSRFVVPFYIYLLYLLIFVEPIA